MGFIEFKGGDFYLLNIIRQRSMQHRQLEYMELRGVTNNDNQKKLEALRMGFRGELQFDDLIGEEIPDVVHLKDYRFYIDDNEYQIDNILLTGDNLFLFEVKNFSFDLKYTPDTWKFMNGKDWIDPITQVDQQRNKFNQLLLPTNYQLPIYSNLVFINPSQTIYNLTEHPKVHTFSNIRKRLNIIHKENAVNHTHLLKFLEDTRVIHSKYNQDIEIEIDKMKKGIVCSECFNFTQKVNRNRFVCPGCLKKFTASDSANELIKEMLILNKESRLSSYRMAALSGGQLSSSLFRKKEVISLWGYNV